MVGKRFGKWVVVEQASSRRHGRAVSAYFVVRCDCGTVAEVRASTLRTKQSTGCKRHTHELPLGQSAANTMELDYKRGAKIRGLLWSLTPNQFRTLIIAPCQYCGDPPSLMKKSKRPVNFNGIDRVDSKQGYVFENCVPCCKVCNFMKRNMSKADFLAQIEKIFKLQEKSS